MDAARNFLDAALKGDYKNASAYMLKDSANLEYLNVTERGYQRLSSDEKSKLKAASLRFLTQNRSMTQQLLLFLPTRIRMTWTRYELYEKTVSGW